ncbi:LmbU family transcriptional regulator [Actinokineospora sp.]|uniref:LmbU family transcriptional regulator n=1 Tax=Actinokineospora sp. TaxID=1872133 RepID=UPI0040378496
MDGAAVTKRTALTISQGMPIHAWRNLGRQIHVISDSSAWWLGDWLLYGQAEYPKRYKHAIAETSLDYQTLRNYAWVARQFAPGRRRGKLSFQHHAEVASLPDAEQEKWLTKAEANGWSRNELRRQVRAGRELGAGAEVPEAETVHFKMNLVSGQKQTWLEAAERAEQDLLGWIVSVLDRAATPALDPAK